MRYFGASALVSRSVEDRAPSALTRRARDGDLHCIEAEREAAEAAFVRHLSVLPVVELSPAVTERARK